MKLTEYLFGLENRNSKRFIKLTYYLMLILTAVAFVFWFSPYESKFFNSEAAFTILFALSTSLIKLFKTLLDEAEYSPALALAHGYVENFLEPAITQLISEGKEPVFHIYKPKSIEELSEKSIERIRGKIVTQNYTLKDVLLEQKYARARDIILIENEIGKRSYIDFPGTLKSLIPYIDYKLASKMNETNDTLKIDFEKKLIDKFFRKIDDLLIKKALSDSVKTYDSQLVFQM